MAKTKTAQPAIKAAPARKGPPIVARRVRGPAHPQHRPDGPIEVTLQHIRTGEYVRSRHHSWVKASARVNGTPRYELVSVIDHSLPDKIKASTKAKKESTGAIASAAV